MQASGIGHAAHLLEYLALTSATLKLRVLLRIPEKMPVTHLEQFVKARGKLVTSELAAGLTCWQSNRCPVWQSVRPARQNESSAVHGTRHPRL